MTSGFTKRQPNDKRHRGSGSNERRWAGLGAPTLGRIRPRLNHATVVAYLALFVALGGGALAATGLGGGESEIHGCVSEEGRLTIVKPGQKCGKHHRRIAWSVRGLQGPAGAQGTQGAQGLAGAQGLQGATGAQGLPGATGEGSSAEQYEVKLSTGESGVPIVELEGFLVAGECEQNSPQFKESVGLNGHSAPGLYWTHESTGISKDEEGYEWDKREVNADLSGRETNGALVHFEVVGVREAGGGCVFAVGITYP